MAQRYELPKIHKPGCLLRSIVSSIGLPTFFFIRTSLLYIIELKKPKSQSRSSTELINKINNIKIPTNQSLISLDVTAFFINIPKELVKKSIEIRYETLCKFTSVPRDDLLN